VAKQYKLESNLVAITDRFKDIYFTGDCLRIKNNVITVLQGFEYDGCTCSKDGNWRLACCFHDILCEHDIEGVSRKMKDLILYDELKKRKAKICKVPIAGIYYLGVRLFGRIKKKHIERLRNVV